MSEAETGRWRLIVDAEKCQGHNRCFALAPDLFRVDDLGFASAAHDAVHETSLDLARRAVRNCPEFAIRLVRGDVEGGKP